MPEHPEAPDRIWAYGYSVAQGGFWADHERDGLTPYLRSTPSRLAADQMLEALKAVAATFNTGRQAPYAEVFRAIAAAQGDENG